jgi:hypothetical protein
MGRRIARQSQEDGNVLQAAMDPAPDPYRVRQVYISAAVFLQAASASCETQYDSLKDDNIRPCLFPA